MPDISLEKLRFIKAFAFCFLSFLSLFYSSIVDLQCCVNFYFFYSKVIQLYISMYFVFFSIMAYHRILNIVPHVVQ